MQKSPDNVPQEIMEKAEAFVKLASKIQAKKLELSKLKAQVQTEEDDLFKYFQSFQRESIVTKDGDILLKERQKKSGLNADVIKATLKHNLENKPKSKSSDDVVQSVLDDLLEKKKEVVETSSYLKVVLPRKKPAKATLKNALPQANTKASKKASKKLKEMVKQPEPKKEVVVKKAKKQVPSESSDVEPDSSSEEDAPKKRGRKPKTA
jgi:hypothetical protein